MATQPWQLSGTEIAALIRNKKLSALEVVQSHSERIDRVNPRLNAIVLRTDVDAMTNAALVDDGVLDGPLAGVVGTTKINTDHVPYPMDNGVRAFKDNISPNTHACIKGLQDAGMSFIGRTNAPAISMRFHTGNDLHGETLNPYGSHLTPGGSSGGAAVAVATGMCAIAQGNDVGGSIRFPAYCNGIFGLRPTVGRMPTGGTNPNPRTFMGAIMSTNGPLARTMDDIRTSYFAMLHPDWNDPLWIPVPAEFPESPSTKRVALVVGDDIGIDPQVVQVVREAGETLRTAGYEVEEVQPPMLNDIFSLWVRLAVLDIDRSIVPALPLFNDDGLTKSFTSWEPAFPERTANTLMGAINDREMILRAWNVFFNDYSLVVLPPWATPFMRANEDIETDDAMQRVAIDGRYMLALCALGLPGLAVPMEPRNGVPTGVQIIAHAWREDLLLQAGDAFEAVRGTVAVLD